MNDPDKTSTLDCLDLQALLSTLLDGALDGDRLHQVERHLAGCDACRRLVGDAEIANDALAAQARLDASLGLPEGFEGAVLSRTVYGRGPRLSETLMTWGGWLAAAACVILAITIWAMDRRPGVPLETGAGGRVAIAPDAAAAFDTVSIARSFTFDESAERAGFRRPEAIPSLSASWNPPSAPARRAEVSRDDAETMYATALLMSEIADLDPGDADRLDRVRQIALYDELVPRLAAARQRLGPDPALFAAESVVRSVLIDGSAPEDLEFLREQAESLRLFEHLNAISDQWRPVQEA
jgi:anti-sigma factor RsiW